jgi:triosephosphate isomerase
MRKLAAGNWKMNGTAASLAEVAALIAAQPDPKPGRPEAIRRLLAGALLTPR